MPRLESFVLLNDDLSHQTLRKTFNRTEKDQDKQKNVPEASWAEPGGMDRSLQMGFEWDILGRSGRERRIGIPGRGDNMSEGER